MSNEHQIVKALETMGDRWLAEQRRTRRWNAVWRTLIGVYFGLFFVIVGAGWLKTGLSSFEEHAGVVRIEGVIARKTGVDQEKVERALDAAYRRKHMRVLVLDIDSPGGSPVQAERIYRSIEGRKAAHPDVPVVAVIGDLGASAAYYIAAAADEIVAAEASLVGSIGVRLDSFGFTDAMQDLGIERRLYTAGEYKGVLDMFSPVSEEAKSHVQQTLDEIHDQFIAAVRGGRGDRLSEDPRLFSGLFWSGTEAEDLGLVDYIGDRESVLAAHGLGTAIDYTRSDIMSAITEGLGTALGSVLGSLELRWR